MPPKIILTSVTNLTLSLAGIDSIEIDTLGWIEADISSFCLPEKYILIVPGCSPKRPQKKWPVENYIELCKKILTETDATPVLIGTAQERDITSNILKNTGRDKVIDLTGKTSLDQIVVLARDARCAIGNDTGPIHLISVTSCPVIVLFNENKKSNPQRHGPLGENVYCFSAPSLSEISPSKVSDLVQKINAN